MWNAYNTVLGSKRLAICTCHLTQCHLRWVLPPYQVACWSIHPFSHNRHGPKIGGGGCAPYGELGSYLTLCGVGRGLPPYRMTSWSIQPFGHNRHGPKSGGCCSVVSSLQITQNSLPHCTESSSGNSTSPVSTKNPLRHEHLFLPKTPYLLHERPSTKHSIKVTEDRVPLNAMMGLQGYNDV